MAATEIPAEVRRILESWLAGVGDILGDGLRAAWLYGSLALGDFAPRWSDVDVCVLLREAIAVEDCARLGRLQRAIYERFVEGHEAGWASGQGIEGPFVTVEECEADGKAHVAWSATEERFEEQGQAALQPFDRHQIARYGIRLTGESVPISVPSREALRGQLRADLDRLEVPRLDRPIWLAGMLHWMARSLVFWRDGQFVSKSEALQREIMAGSPFSEAFALALRLRTEGTSACAACHDALRTQFQATAPRVVEVLAPLA